MRIFVLVALVICLAVPVSAQLLFVDRMEVETRFSDNDFFLLKRQEGLLGFRTVAEKGFNAKMKFQYFLTDENLKGQPIREISIKDGYDLSAFDIDGDVLYAVFMRGFGVGSDKYLLEIELNRETAKEIQLSNLLPTELVEFMVINQHAVFMGLSESRPVVQIFDVKNQSIITPQGLYYRDTKIMHVSKDQELGVIDLLVSRRDRYKVKQVTLLTYDEDGNKLREVVLDKLENSKYELVEGFLTPMQDYQQSVLGTFGYRRREMYLGLYKAAINEFGEYKIDFYTVADLPNFYSFLKPKVFEKKTAEIERSVQKGKIPYIRPVVSAREIIPTDRGFLVYSDHFTANYPRNIRRDGVYANNAFNYGSNPGFPGTFFMPQTLDQQIYGAGRQAGFDSNRGEFRYQSSHFAYFHEDGRVLWDNALNLGNRISYAPGKFGEISFDGRRLHYLYIEGVGIKMSYLKDGQRVFENIAFDLALLNEEERIRETQEGSLRLQWWYGDYFLLSGKQKVRYLSESGREQVKDVFFVTKIKVDGELYKEELAVTVQ